MIPHRTLLLEVGQCVRIQYTDHILWADHESSKFTKPWTLEACGWVVAVNESAIELVFERLVEPRTDDDSGGFIHKGVTIVRSTILGAEVLT